MKFFRINIYLSLYDLFISFFYYKNLNNKVSKLLSKYTLKKYNILTSQCRVSFLIVLKYLKKKFPEKNEIIVQSYNLPEMINVAKILNFKIIYIDIEKISSSISVDQIIKKISHKTAAILLTNMFNSIEHSLEIKKICNERDVTLIEDNAIYFDNFYKSNNLKKYSGSIGDISISSFGMMKNLSSLYGGSISTNSSGLNDFSNNIINNLRPFPITLLVKQIIIYLILKLLSNRLLYNFIFFKIIEKSYFKNQRLLSLFYPSLKFRIKERFPNYYLSKISRISLNIIYFQLRNNIRRVKNHNARKENNKIYYNKLSNLRKIKLIKIKDFDFQNFLEFPILVDDKSFLIKYLLSEGIDCRFFYYSDCKKIFDPNFDNLLISKYYEESIICLPSHHQVKSKYIFKICDILLKYDELN